MGWLSPCRNRPHVLELPPSLLLSFCLYVLGHPLELWSGVSGDLAPRKAVVGSLQWFRSGELAGSWLLQWG